MDARYLSRRKIYGAIQRIIHAWIGATVVALVALGWFSKLVEPGSERAPLIQAHIFLGYGLIVGFVARLIWGMIGPEHGRMSALIHPAAWSTAVRKFKLEKPKAFGHDAFASVAYLLLYVAISISVASGLALAGMRYDMGPFAATLFDDLRFLEWTMTAHEAVLYIATGFTVLHIAAMIMHEKKRGYPIAQAMVTGYQYRPSSPEDKDHE